MVCNSSDQSFFSIRQLIFVTQVLHQYVLTHEETVERRKIISDSRDEPVALDATIKGADALIAKCVHMSSTLSCIVPFMHPVVLFYNPASVFN